MGEGYFLDIIFFAMLAAFIFLRLRGVLGRRTGHEERRREAYRLKQQEQENSTVVPLPERQHRDGTRPNAEKAPSHGGPVAAALTQIQVADPRFEPAEFLQGARAAYEMIVTAFAKGDRDTLRGLLSEDVFEGFSEAIEARESAGQTMETTIATIRETEISDASLEEDVATVTVRFVSDIISVTRDAGGAVVGEEPREREVIDVWSFSRGVKSRDPNWFLVETHSEGSD